MKETIYRAWDKVLLMMLEVTDISFVNETIKYINPKDKNCKKETSFDMVELIQFTGLRDKNKKMIFEGDKLRHPDFEHPIDVIFDRGCFIDESTRTPLKDINHWGDWVICGNKFEDGVRDE